MTRARRYKYEAMVKLLPQQAGDPEGALPGPVCHAVVRAEHLETHRGNSSVPWSPPALAANHPEIPPSP
jgi:hypothetical protein